MIILKEPLAQDEELFLSAMKRSSDFHFPFISTPDTAEAFQTYLSKSQIASEQYFIAWNEAQEIIGVFNISGMIQGVFKSAYLGYFATTDHAGKGLMSEALNMVLKEVFTSLDLHRIEANIQPNNTASSH